MDSETAPNTVLYADDSGNTGPDLLNADQPLAVTAIVVVTAEQQSLLDRHVSGLLGALTQVPRELKFQRLAKSRKGKALIGRIIELLCDLQLPLFFSVTEKRFLAASLFVEAFLDPICNDNVAPHFSEPSTRKMAANLVNVVSSDDMLRAFLQASREGRTDSLTAVAERVASLLRFHPAPAAPHLAEAIARSAPKPFVPRLNPEHPRLMNRPTAHTFSLVALLWLVDQHLLESGMRASLIADTDLQFGPVLASAFRLATQVDIGPNPYSDFITPITHILSRTDAHSDDVLGLQLADLSAGLIATSIAAESASVANGNAAAWETLCSMLRNAPPSSYWVTSEGLLRRLSGACRDLLPPMEPGSVRWG